MYSHIISVENRTTIIHSGIGLRNEFLGTLG